MIICVVPIMLNLFIDILGKVRDFAHKPANSGDFSERTQEILLHRSTYKLSGIIAMNYYL